MNIHCSYQNFLFWTDIVWHTLSANLIVRCFKLKKLKNYMKYQVDLFLASKLQKIYYFRLCWKILLANQLTGFSTFDLLYLLILILGAHCYIVFVHNDFFHHKLIYMKPHEIKVRGITFHLYLL